MPPTIGFPARLLVLIAAFRLSAPLALLVLVGVLVQVVASTRVVMARLSDPSPAVAGPPRLSQRLAIGILALAAVIGGILPGVLLSRVWGIG